MSTLYAVADWVVSLNRWQLTALTLVVMAALLALAIGAAFALLAVSGAGETNDGEMEGDK